LFRHRQKARVQELEKTVEDLTCNNNEVKMKLELLTFENKILKDQLLYLRNLISSGAIPLPPSSGSLEKADLSLITSSSTTSTTSFVNNTAPPSVAPLSHPIPALLIPNTTNVNSCDTMNTTTNNHDSTFVTTTNNNDSTTNSTTSTNSNDKDNNTTNNNKISIEVTTNANNVGPALNHMVSEHIL